MVKKNSILKCKHANLNDYRFKKKIVFSSYILNLLKCIKQGFLLEDFHPIVIA